jgi:aspartyl/glutamyl-tRNA(Asn/Gln) amidotransferase C subunit
MISFEEVKKLALLVRIEVDRKELEELQNDLERILDYVSQLQKAPSREITFSKEELKTPELFNIFREDEPIENKSDIKRGEHIRVKHIL